MADLYDTYTMRNGAVLISVKGFVGDDDYYRMHALIKDVIKPDDEGYSVDSMCIGGYFKKDGVLIRTSSDSPYETLSFFYQPKELSQKQCEEVIGWIDAVVAKLNE